MIWIETQRELPSGPQKVLVAILNQFSNAPWEYSLRSAFYFRGYWMADSDSAYSITTPDYWMPYPDPPPLVRSEIAKAAAAKRWAKPEDGEK